MAKHPPKAAPKKVVVRLLKPHGSAFAGELVGHDEAHAAKLVQLGAAEYFAPPTSFQAPETAPNAKALESPPADKMVSGDDATTKADAQRSFRSKRG